MTDEGRLKAAITKTLERKGYLVLRLQSGMFKTFDGRIVRVGVKGLPDLLAIDGDSRAAFIELKRPGRSKIYQCQLDYIAMLQKRGIRAGIARSPEEALAIMEGEQNDCGFD